MEDDLKMEEDLKNRKMEEDLKNGRRPQKWKTT